MLSFGGEIYVNGDEISLLQWMRSLHTDDPVDRDVALSECTIHDLAVASRGEGVGNCLKKKKKKVLIFSIGDTGLPVWSNVL